MLTTLIDMAGPLFYPLGLCSILALALVLDRLWAFLRYPPLRVGRSVAQFDSASLGTAGKGLQGGLQLLRDNAWQPKTIRDDKLSLWLTSQRQAFHAHLRWLMLIGTIAPLLGLFGTVLGIISMFQNVALQPGPVTPGLLAEGMWEAMYTTAMGMAIAIPALVAFQAFSIWADGRIDKMQHALNRCAIKLDERESLAPKFQPREEVRAA